MKINIYLDKTGELKPQGAVFFEDENSYFEAYLKIYESVKSDTDIILITRSLLLKELIKAAFFSYAKVDFVDNKEITYRSLLSSKWNISQFDFEPSNKEIKDQKLLDYDFHSDNPLSFSTIIISNFVSQYLTGLLFPVRGFGNLLNDLAKFKKTENSFPPIVNRVLNFKHILFLKQDSSNQKIIDLIFTKPIELFDNACLLTLIQGYPTPFREKLQNQQWAKLLSAYNLKEIDISEFMTRSELFSQFKDELDIFLKGLKSGLNQISFNNLIDSMSGMLVEEFDFIIEILKEKSEFITHLLLKKLSIKFLKLNTAVLDQLEMMADNIPPDFDLPKFNSKQNINLILSDAVQYYYPYKIWADNTAHIDDSTLLWGELFSEFILREYEKISYHYDNFIHRFIHNFNQLIKETELVIILVIDNLNYKYFKYLQEAFHKYNIVLLDQPVPYLSLLPTTTSVGKFAIIAGTRDKIDSTKTTYEPIINNTWQKYFPEHSLFYYHSELSNISTHQVKGKEIIFINYLGVDAELHSSPQKTLIDHKEKVKYNLEKLCKILDLFIKRNRKEDVVKIFFISDHGSTIIPESYPNPIEDIKFKILFPEADISPDHRFIRINSKEFNELKNNENISNSLYCMDSKISGDGHNYVIAKGYGRFKKAVSDSYVHGGATPEEMIIPGGCFVFQKSIFKEIIIQLQKTEFRYLTLESCPIRLANPNDKTIERIQIEIFENESLKIKIFDIDDILPKNEIFIEAKIKLSIKDNSNIKIVLNYIIDGNVINIEKEFPVKSKSIVKTTFDLDKLLDF